MDSRLRGNCGWWRSGRGRADHHSRSGGNDVICVRRVALATAIARAKAKIHRGQPFPKSRPQCPGDRCRAPGAAGTRNRPETPAAQWRAHRDAATCRTNREGRFRTVRQAIDHRSAVGLHHRDDPRRGGEDRGLPSPPAARGNRVHHLSSRFELRRHHRGRDPAAAGRVQSRSALCSAEHSEPRLSRRKPRAPHRAKPASIRPCSSAARSNQPLGEFSNTMEVLDTGLFDKYGIGRIGIAGHPEGSPDIPDSQIREALAWKNAFAERTGASLYIVTQFCFEAVPVIAWDKRIQSEGNRLPVYIGIPRPRVAQGPHRAREGLRRRPVDALPHPPGPPTSPGCSPSPRPTAWSRASRATVPRTPGAASAGSTSTRWAG